jgi:hypothetical protein
MPQNYGCAENFVGLKSYGKKYLSHRRMVDELLRLVALAAVVAPLSSIA